MQNNPLAINSPSFVQTDQNRSYIYSSYVYEKIYESNKYLHQLYVDILHSMESEKGILFSTLVCKIGLERQQQKSLLTKAD